MKFPNKQLEEIIEKSKEQGSSAWLSKGAQLVARAYLMSFHRTKGHLELTFAEPSSIPNTDEDIHAASEFMKSFGIRRFHLADDGSNHLESLWIWQVNGWEITGMTFAQIPQDFGEDKVEYALILKLKED